MSHSHTSDAPTYTNRLIDESSPYLLQHAHNPVDWFAWGDEAFERRARKTNPFFSASVTRPAIGAT